MCATLSLPSTNIPSALNAVFSGTTVQSDEYQAGDRFWLKPQTHSRCSPRQEYPRSNISSQNQREFQGGFSHFLRELGYSFPHFSRGYGVYYTLFQDVRLTIGLVSGDLSCNSVPHIVSFDLKIVNANVFNICLLCDNYVKM